MSCGQIKKCKVHKWNPERLNADCGVIAAFLSEEIEPERTRVVTRLSVCVCVHR